MPAEIEPVAKSTGEQRAVVTSPRKAIERVASSGSSSEDRATTGAELLYPRRDSKGTDEPRQPKVTVIGEARTHRATPFPRTIRAAAVGDATSSRKRRPATIARETIRDEGGGGRYRTDMGPGDRTRRHDTYRHERHMRYARREWCRHLRRRHNDWWVSFGFTWGTPYIWEPYWYPYRPYVGRWDGYRSWYHCTPYTTGIWWPWHRRVCIGYVYAPYTYRYHAPYTTSIWLGYDPFLYFWWPAPYSVSVNYYTYEYGNYPPDSVRNWSSNDWVYYEPSTDIPAEIETPLYTGRETYVTEPTERFIEESPAVVPVETETVPPEPIEEPAEQVEKPTPAGVAEAATLVEEERTDIEPAAEPMPAAVTEMVESAPHVEAEPPPLKPSISVPAPGRGPASQAMLATGGVAFLCAALWMAWPRP